VFFRDVLAGSVVSIVATASSSERTYIHQEEH